MMLFATLAAPGPFGPFTGDLRSTKDGRVIALLPQGTLPRDPMRENGGQDHATFLLPLPSGELLMAWFSGLMEAEEPMHIALSRLAPGAKKWEPTVAVAHTVDPGHSNQNPVLVHDAQTDLLHLYHPTQYVGMGQANSTVVRLTSSDAGRTWSSAVPTFTGKGAFVRGAPIEARDGSLLLPMYYTPHGYDPQTHYDYSAVQRSEAARKAGAAPTWTETVIGNSSGMAQPTMVRRASGELVVFFRDRFCDSIRYSVSTDDGRTWSAPKKTRLPNNNSGIWAAALKSGAIAMVFNNAHTGRTPLTIALSYDGGGTWPFMRNLESEPLPLDQNCTCGRGWSPTGPPVDHYHKNCQPAFAYPTVSQSLPDEKLHVSYDHNRQVAVYQTFTEAWVRGGA